MSKYLLSTYSKQASQPQAPPSQEQMAERIAAIAAVEEELDNNGAFVFGGALHGPDAATVVDVNAETLMVDGPFVESKEHIAGFYIIEADDLDSALAWAEKVSEAIGNVIEVRPFAASGRVKT